MVAGLGAAAEAQDDGWVELHCGIVQFARALSQAVGEGDEGHARNFLPEKDSQAGVQSKTAPSRTHEDPESEGAPAAGSPGCEVRQTSFHVESARHRRQGTFSYRNASFRAKL